MTKQASDELARIGRLVSARVDAPRYSAAAVQKEIARDPRIGKREAARIHALLQGWRG